MTYGLYHVLFTVWIGASIGLFFVPRWTSNERESTGEPQIVER
ncbi:hypothetical protein BLGI_3205 [Brevibacillus laterosporus GI-9]|nr:hypothetical protein BLGI_3205 [Brevibacillus laterosporus GI-9]